VRQLITLHIRFLLSEKVRVFMVLLLMLALGFFLYSVSNVNEQMDQVEIILLLDILSLGKLWVMVFLLFLMMLAFIIHQYDVILLNRVSKERLEITRLLAIVVLLWWMVTMYVMLFALVCVVFLPSLDVLENLASLYLDLLFLSGYYLILFWAFFQVSQHLLGLIGGFFLYMVVYIGGIHFVAKDQVGDLFMFLSLFLVDLLYYEGDGFDFYYSKIYYLGLILGLMIGVFALRKNADLIN